jgi:hypothetical protein
MKIIKVMFHVATSYIGSEEQEAQEIKVEDNLTEEQENKIIDEHYKIWVNENTDQSWWRIEI